ncbi:NTP/NDP exchange transporter [Chiayiivirga flava]|uniref:AAA family ATP:ADP antiporter n=1 Tax=Chiayiivirga flava TaxID=659595 RepID=A0A7W8D8P0_9GAMM|nr:MFS transporter [Chiayiivirga flava]MBB5208830.1 AAA family ATP:ADP antiporter [Chiayiivirga flava]
MTERAVHRIQHVRDTLRESPPLLWAFLYFFFLLTAYYILRPVREAMGASRDLGALFPQAMIDWFATRGVALEEFVLQVLFTCTFFIMIALQPVYGALVSRYPRRVFLPIVYGVFIACLLLFHLAFEMELPGRGMAFFLWLTVFNLFAVTVFWSFMADVFADVDARRVYGYIGAGGTLGAMLGPTLTSLLVERVGIANLLLVSAVFLALCIVFIMQLRPYAVARERRLGLASGEVPMGGEIMAGLKLVAREPLLRALAVLMIFGVGVGTLLYNEQNAIARAAYATNDAATAFFSRIDLAINTLTLVIQLGLTRWLLSRYGVAPALLIPAFAILLGFSLLAASPLPILVWMVQVATRAGEFSLAKPARETIYTRVPREWRYKAGAAIDTVIYRAGDVTFAWVYKGLAVFGSAAVFGVGALVALGMTVGAWRVIRAQARLPATPRDAPASDAATPT